MFFFSFPKSPISFQIKARCNRLVNLHRVVVAEARSEEAESAIRPRNPADHHLRRLQVEGVVAEAEAAELRLQLKRG